MSQKIKRNAIECRHCGTIVESRHRHDFRQHICSHAGFISTEYDHTARCYKPSFPYMAVDGGLEYVRVLGDPKDYIMRTEYEA